jgi:arylformamidase
MINRPPLTPAFIEAEYNNRGLVPEYPEHLARWVQDSEVARASVPFTTLRYGAQLGATMDIFHAKNPRGLLFFIHGGYWRALSKDDFSFVAPTFCAQGISVAIVNYDLCPAITVAGIVDEMVSALHTLAAQANTPSRWLVAGHSAGGHLTAALWSELVSLAPNVAERIVGGMSISGVHDMDPMVDYSINTDLKLTHEEAHRLSPLAYAPSLDAPLIVTAGARESSEFRRQATILHAAWPSVCQHPKAGLVFAPGRNHFSVVEALTEPEHELTTRLTGLLS